MLQLWCRSNWHWHLKHEQRHELPDVSGALGMCVFGGGGGSKRGGEAEGLGRGVEVFSDCLVGVHRG